jgi:hypothetical protein
MDELRRKLYATLASAGTPQKKAWWEKYLKNVITFWGVPMAEVRKLVNIWWEEHGKHRDLDEQKELALGLFECQVAEGKVCLEFSTLSISG